MTEYRKKSPTVAGNMKCMDCRCGGYGCPGMPAGYELSLMKSERERRTMTDQLTKAQSDKLIAYKDALRQLPIEVVLFHIVAELRARPDLDADMAARAAKAMNDVHWEFL
jgi:hypothetical protein